MKTKSKLYHKAPGSETFEISEVVNPGTLEEYNRLIGYLVVMPHCVEWEHTATLRRSGSCFPRRDQALRALKKVHQQHKNGLTLKAV